MYSSIQTNSFQLRDEYIGSYTGFECDGPNAILLLLIMLLYILLRVVSSVLVIFSKLIFNSNFGKKQVKSGLCLIANAP